MTIVEFYDKASIENIVGALLCQPAKVVFVCDKHKELERAINLYRGILDRNNVASELAYRTVNRNNLQEIIDTLAAIVEEHDDCVFDLTGGEDLYLVAVGAIMERYKGRVQCHRFNLKSDMLNDCDADGNVCSSRSFDISIRDNIAIYGGQIVTDEKCEIYTYPWDFNEEFLRDIDAMWDICRNNTRLWNAQIGTLGAVCEAFANEDPMHLCFDKKQASPVLREMGIKLVCAPWILNELNKHGLISSLVMGDTVSLVFKNEQVKRCLTVSGQILELAVASKMIGLRDKEGLPLYHDVRVGVVIDWDRPEAADLYRTVNEIDVMAMRGSIPVFISCKNGFFDVNELYKLNTVAGRFGHKYAKKVLVSTELDKLGQRGEYIRARMEDMKIRSVENVDAISSSEFERILRSLWSN